MKFKSDLILVLGDDQVVEVDVGREEHPVGIVVNEGIDKLKNLIG